MLGASYFVTPSVNLFGEVIHANGWVPLNFLSGGNLPGGAAWSEFDATTNAIVVGAQAAFYGLRQSQKRETLPERSGGVFCLFTRRYSLFRASPE